MGKKRQLETELREAQRLATVGRLAAGIAHDFRNLLTVIQGHAGLIRAEAHLTPELEESVQQIMRAAERAGKLSARLLSFSRKTAPQPHAIDLNQLLAEMSGLLHRTIGEDVEFEFQYDSNLPLVHADPRLIEQCVLTVALNAREAMPDGGQLLVSTSIADIDAAHAAHHPEARPGRFVCLGIVDSAAAPTERSAVEVTNECSPLRAVEQIAKEHQGWIESESQTGHSAFLRIYLPVYTGSDKLQTSDTQKISGRETLLVVEDEAPLRSIMRTMLERHGFHVLEASSGIEALAVWHQHHDDISLLLTDVVMPAGLSGQELAEQFHAQKPNLKILYTSGYSPRAAGNVLSAENGADFLEKPFDETQLATAVRRCLDRQGS
ncbi:MAG TPA: response regulator [Candidatus Binatia bacterium]|nr:response regulator [Candidatus Binatia bacterium]